MSYEQDYLAARNKYLKTIEPLEPSSILETFIKEEKPKVLAKGLDDSNGKSYEVMARAHVAFDTYYKTYVKKIETQCLKEKKSLPANFKAPLPTFTKALKAIADSFLQDCATKQEDDQEKQELAEEAIEAKASAANAAAEAASKRNIGIVVAEFKKRREAGRTAATTVEERCILGRTQMNQVVTAMRQQVATALTYMQTGNLRAAGGLKIATNGQVTRANALAAGAKTFYDDTMKPFFAERNMSGKSLAESMRIDIPEKFQALLSTECQKHSAIFTQQTAKTANAKRIVDELAKLAEEAADLREQTVGIIDGGDLAAVFLTGASKAAGRINTIVAAALGDAEKLDTGTSVRLAGALQILKAQKPPDQIDSSKGMVKTLFPFFRTTLEETKQSAATARQLLDAERNKLPGDHKTGPAGKALEPAAAELDKLEKLNSRLTNVLAGLEPKATPYL